MADDVTQRWGRFKEYMRHHNTYKFKPARLAARRRSGRVNLLKADKNPCPTICQSGNNDQEFDNRGMCGDSIFRCDVNSSEFSGEQMQDTSETVYSDLEELLDVSLGESELLDFTNTPYERFVTEDDDACSQTFSDFEDHEAYFGKGTGNCKICGRSISKTDGFFIEVPIEKQLHTFFTDPEFVQGLRYRFQRVKRDDENIEDVYDGAVYQRKFGPGRFLSEPYNLSLKLNTDGVAISHSSQFGVWPLFLLVNELPLHKGIEITLPDRVKTKLKVMALSGHFDLPARAGVLKQVTYTGHDSCSYCEEHGDVVKTGARGHVMTFPFQNTVSGHAELQTAHSVEAHSYSALEQNSTVNGIVEKVDNRLLEIKPPSIITRVPRSIQHHLKFWKGPRYVLMNQHMLLHLKKSVIDHGPLWCSSLFVFEDCNGDIASYFHGIQNVAHQVMTDVPRIWFSNYVGAVTDHFYAVGAMKKGKSTNADYEDDLPLFLGVESISDVTFFSRLQIREAVFHSRAYKRISRRNNYAIAYQQGDSIYYGYIEAFFSVRSNPSVACGAVIAPMSISGRHVCKSHEVLGNLISHIVCLHEPNKNRFTVAPPKDIIDI
ncbi:hypothetical protein AWC38_SpisGene22296 [Stylophora pistillata]|uniref:Uncharacterized protein n=1 Tax=Stylophora pistillata TaxID=50429 RepID=A0A2B4RBJ6_STYPI|nr:hypothetical protein AWC38_SpisGene22296 [Stylophora pistillata]